MDSRLLGETTAKLMDYLDHDERVRDAEMLAVGIVVVLQAEDEDGQMTWTRTFSSEDVHYRALGLFHSAVEVVSDGLLPEDE